MASGAANLKRKLERAGRAAKAAGFMTLQRYAGTIAGAMKAAAPIEDGALRESIRVEPLPNELAVKIRAGGPTTQVPVRKGSGETVDNAILQEFGTVDQPANPFFRPALHA